MCGCAKQAGGEHTGQIISGGRDGGRQIAGEWDGAGVRVDDDDRRRLADLLTRAAGAGLLTLAEVDQRLAATWQSQNRGDLDALTADLPPAFLRAQHDVDRANVRAGTRAAEARAGWQPHLAAYVGVMMLLTVLWMAGGFGFPWPIFPALGWGIGLWQHGHAAGAIGHRGRPAGLTSR